MPKAGVNGNNETGFWHRRAMGVISLTNPPATPGGPTLDQQTLATLYATGGYKNIPALAQFVSSTTNGGFTYIVVNTNAQLDSDGGKRLVDHLRAGDTAAGLDP